VLCVKDTTAALLTLVLGLVALLHAYWGLGGLWPGESEADLIARVIGDGRRHMPPRPVTWIVACLIGIAAIWPLILDLRTLPFPVNWLATAGGLVLALVFLGRGVAGYTPGWRRGHSAEPFASLDRSYYSPLCLVIGAAFAYLLIG
jgi:hypothetical protein